MIATAASIAPPVSEGPAFGGSTRLKRPMPLNKPHKTLPVAANTSQDHAGLLERVGTAQDKAAFVELFNYFAPRVKSYMLKQGASESAAEEIVQNTFITVWEKAKSYNPKKSAASTWIFTVARNKRIDALRRDKFVEVNSDDAALENAVADNGEAQYADDQEVDRLNSAVNALPPEQAELVRMAFFDEKSHADISAEKKIPLGTVKSRLRLAMDKLRTALSVKGENK